MGEQTQQQQPCNVADNQLQLLHIFVFGEALTSLCIALAVHGFTLSLFDICVATRNSLTLVCRYCCCCLIRQLALVCRARIGLNRLLVARCVAHSNPAIHRCLHARAYFIMHRQAIRAAQPLRQLCAVGSIGRLTTSLSTHCWHDFVFVWKLFNDSSKRAIMHILPTLPI